QEKTLQEKVILKKNIENIKGEKRSSISKIEKLEKETDEITDAKTIEYMLKKISQHEDKIKVLDISEKEAKQRLKDVDKTPVTLKEFSELMTNLPDWLANQKDLDKVNYVIGKT